MNELAALWGSWLFLCWCWFWGIGEIKAWFGEISSTIGEILLEFGEISCQNGEILAGPSWLHLVEASIGFWAEIPLISRLAK